MRYSPHVDANGASTRGTVVRIELGEPASAPADALTGAIPPSEPVRGREPGRSRVSILARQDMLRLFDLLNAELGRADIKGELHLVGGAVMCIAYAQRPATYDVDAIFQPAAAVREAAARVALKAGVDEKWLNDSVKGYLSAQGTFEPFLELDHLGVMVARADYMLAMKCLSMRIGAEFHDLDDVRYLLRHLDIQGYQQALELIGKFYPLERFPQKTLYALEELLNQK